jgi:endonuclease/exonuclease/phosphatase family metal-dependent hydrolase
LQITTTHLDNTPGPDNTYAIQKAQAAEAIRSLSVPIGSLSNPALPIVLPPLVFMGDFNVDPRDVPNNPTFPTYQLLTNPDAGFSDAWKQVHPTSDGYTCCQRADLRNPTSELSLRIDLVLTRGVSVEDIQLVGDQPSDRTLTDPPLWPSDHAGLLATLKIGE